MQQGGGRHCSNLPRGRRIFNEASAIWRKFLYHLKDCQMVLHLRTLMAWSGDR